MKFIPEDIKLPIPTFGEVEDGQYFKDGGYLYVRVDASNAVRLTNEVGVPDAEIGPGWQENMEIDKVLPKIKKIEF